MEELPFFVSNDASFSRLFKFSLHIQFNISKRKHGTDLMPLSSGFHNVSNVYGLRLSLEKPEVFLLALVLISCF